ncbi:MAG: RNA polymerase sigma factor [Robiginitalea sp.]|uniref:RNA polymerase sigma factor n=1 Tax=Robiginitalea sp. TaxID=1902411 RepID=UPI003C721356
MNNQKVSDSDLIREVLSGNTRSYTTLLNRYQHMVFTLAMRMLGNRELAEETTQDIFVKSYKSLPSFRGDSKFSTWLYRIAYRSILDVSAREMRTPRRIDDYSEIHSHNHPSDSTWETIMIMERRAHIIKALEQLSPRDNSVLSLYYLQELSIHEIAEVTDLSKSVVKVSLFRARERFKAILESTEEGIALRTYNT